MKKFTFLFAFVFASAAAFAQIPNSGFENWHDDSVSVNGTMNYFISPDFWDTANPEMLQLGSTPSTNESSLSYSGASAATLTSNSVSVGGGLNAAISGALASGNISYANFTLNFNGGFPFTARPGQLTGYYKYVPMGGDSMAIWVKLTRWTGSARETVAYGRLASAASVSVYSPFSVDLHYSSTANPDTALIVALSTSQIVKLNGTGGSTLTLDNLAFMYSAGIESVNAKPINVYPNPVTTRLTLDAQPGAYNEALVYDLTGRVVATFAVQGNVIDASALNNGQYVLELRNRDGVVRSAFAKQ